MDKTELINRIISEEWTMFRALYNTDGGKADCQDQPETFRIMRSSQFAPWSMEALKSYQDDLFQAQAAGNNLLAEKYRIMEELQKKGQEVTLPEYITDGCRQSLTLEICRLYLEAADSFYSMHGVPPIGRVLFIEEEKAGETSIERYMWGELATYSVRTLEMLLKKLREDSSNGNNIYEAVMDQTARAYGYTSIKEYLELGKR